MPFKRIRQTMASADTAADEIAITAKVIGDLIDALIGEGLEITIKTPLGMLPISIGLKPGTPKETNDGT